MSSNPVPPPREEEGGQRMLWLAGIGFVAVLLVGGVGVLLVLPYLARQKVKKEAEVVKQAVSLKVTYMKGLGGHQNKAVTITDPDELRELLSAIEVTSVNRAIWISDAPYSEVVFTQPDGTVMMAKFAGRGHLDLQGLGQVYLTHRFYEKVCEALSRRAGKDIDVLSRNN